MTPTTKTALISSASAAQTSVENLAVAVENWRTAYAAAKGEASRSHFANMANIYGESRFFEDLNRCILSHGLNEILSGNSGGLKPFADLTAAQASRLAGQ